MENKLKSYLTVTFALILFIILILVKECVKPQEALTQQDTIKTDNVHRDTVIIKEPAIPYVIYRNRYKIIKETVTKDSLVYLPGKVVEVPIQVDSSLLLSKYYATNYQMIETTLDSGYSSIVTVDAISRNKILARKTYLKTFKKRSNQTNVYLVAPEKPKKAEWYLGGGTSVSRDFFNSMYGGVIYKTKKDEIYQLNAGIVNRSPLGQYVPYVGASIYFKVSK